MLHMVVNTHQPGDCAFRSGEAREALFGGLDALIPAAEKHGATVVDVWVSKATHTTFTLIDADNAHVIDTILGDSGLIALTDARVYPVHTLDAVKGQLGG